MNEIVRFKKSRMIPKALNGQRFKKVGRSTWGYTIWVDTETGHFYTGEWDDAYGQDPNRDYGTDKWGKYTDEGTHMTAWHGLLGGHSIEFNGSDYVRRRPTTPAQAATQPVNPGHGSLVTSPPPAPKPAAQRNNGVIKPAVNWNDKFASFTGSLTDAQKNYLTDNGVDYSSAQGILNFLLSKGVNLGKWGADNKWGTTSQSAWNTFASAYIPSNYSKKQSTVHPSTPAVQIELKVEMPDFGYATNQDYSNGRQFKGLGFNRYQGLQAFAKGDSQFAQDLRQRFGQNVDAWDLKGVESALNIGGKYRGNDFGDMARSMQTWKTNTNQLFDTKRAEYAKRFINPNPAGLNTLGDAGVTLGSDISKLQGDPIYGQYVS